MEISGHIHDPVAVLPGRQPQLLSGEAAAWAPVLVWTFRQVCLPCHESNRDYRFVQPVAYPYSDWATSAP